MKILKCIIAITLSVSIVGCGEPQDTGSTDGDGMILDHQLKTLEAAKGTEQIIMDADANRRKELE